MKYLSENELIEVPDYLTERSGNIFMVCIIVEPENKEKDYIVGINLNWKAMNNFVSPVSSCCNSDFTYEYVQTSPDGADPMFTCSQCGNTCEIVEGDEDTLQFEKELDRADFRIKEAKENSI